MKKIIALIMLLGFSGAYAAGTTAGTAVTNSVTLDYTVGGVNQTDITATDGNGFLVDNRNDVNVVSADSGTVKVTPGSTLRVLTFTVTNEGNFVQDFILSATQDGGDNFDATSVNVFVESGATIGYQAGEDTATSIIDLAADGAKTVYIVSTIPSAPGNGALANLYLTAQVADSAGVATVNAASTADAEDTVQIVWADGAGVVDAATDGKFSAQGTYEVQSASLTVTKGSCVIWDPVNLSNGFQKRIPLSVVRYTVQVTNAAAAQDATSVIVTDILPTQVAYGVGSSGLTAVARVVDGVCSCASPGTANAGTVGAVTGTVTINYDGAISASESQCAYFDVTIQ